MQFVAEQKMTGTIWNFVSVPNAMETKNIVRNIYLHIHISNNQEDMILCAGQKLYVRWDQIPIKNDNECTRKKWNGCGKI